MRRRRPFIEQRRPVYVGCEGLSECGYARLLQEFISDRGLSVHLIIDELGPGAGDPLARVEMAVRHIAHLRRTRVAPVDRFVLLDTDQAERDPVRAERARRIAGEHDIRIVWQEPCFEAVLLRHMPARAANRPVDSPSSERALLREWPEYEKPMNLHALKTRIDIDAVLRAAAVEGDLAAMLRCLGLMAGADEQQ